MTTRTDAAALPGHGQHHIDQGAALLLMVLCAIWGLNQVAIKLATAGISPLFQAGVRSICATVLVLLWARWRGVRLFERDGTMLWGLIAGALFGLEFLFLYQGLTYTTAARGVLFLYTSPFVVAIGAHFLFPGDRLTRMKVLGLLSAFAGLLVAFADSLSLPSWHELPGDIMCFIGAILWGATTLVIKASPLARASAEKTLLYQLAVSAVMLTAASAVMGERGIFNPTPLVIGAFLYQIVIVAFASFTIWFWMVAKYSASRLTAFSFMTPIFGVAFGGLLLGERVSPALAAAVVLIALGIYLVARPEGATRR